jgi:hypothetical protein
MTVVGGTSTLEKSHNAERVPPSGEGSVGLESLIEAVVHPAFRGVSH